MTSNASNRAEESAGKEFVMSRVLDAGRNKVWTAWTTKEALEQWWGPKGFAMQVVTLDLRAGGVFRYSMRSPDGRTMWGKFVYRQTLEPERLVFAVSFTDEQGNAVRHPFSATWPLEVLSTVLLQEERGKTRLTMTGVPFNATEEECRTFALAHDGMRQGWTGTLDQLADCLAKLEG